MPFKLGYNTNGFAHHRLADAIEVLAEIGYTAVAITLDHDALDPFSMNLREDTNHIRRLLQAQGMSCVIETGARFLLDPRRKHWPTLVSANEEERRRRFDFLCRAMEIAARLEAEAVSFWSGRRDAALPADAAWSILTDTCGALLARADRLDHRLAFEPEPGMFVQTLAQYRRLADELDHRCFGLTLDVGHVHCLQDGPPAGRIMEFATDLLNVHIEDMKAGTHEHLMFGEGEMDFDPVFHAIEASGYTGSVNVELSGHSRDAVNAAKQAFDCLSRFVVSKAR